MLSLSLPSCPGYLYPLVPLNSGHLCSLWTQAILHPLIPWNPLVSLDSGCLHPPSCLTRHRLSLPSCLSGLRLSLPSCLSGLRLSLPSCLSGLRLSLPSCLSGLRLSLPSCLSGLRLSLPSCLSGLRLSLPSCLSGLRLSRSAILSLRIPLSLASYWLSPSAPTVWCKLLHSPLRSGSGALCHLQITSVPDI